MLPLRRGIRGIIAVYVFDPKNEEDTSLPWTFTGAKGLSNAVKAKLKQLGAVGIELDDDEEEKKENDKDGEYID